MLGQVKEVKLKRPLIVWCYQFEKYKLGAHKKTKRRSTDSRARGERGGKTTANLLSGFVGGNDKNDPDLDIGGGCRTF